MTNYILARQREDRAFVLYEVGKGGVVGDPIVGPKDLEAFGNWCDYEKGISFAEKDLLINSSAPSHGLPVTFEEIFGLRKRLAA